jgi:hypothetical protein
MNASTPLAQLDVRGAAVSELEASLPEKHLFVFFHFAE